MFFFFYMWVRYPDSKIHGANMGPTWLLWAPGGSHVSPMNLAIRVPNIASHLIKTNWLLFCKNVFSWKKGFVFWYEFHWCVLLSGSWPWGIRNTQLQSIFGAIVHIFDEIQCPLSNHQLSYPQECPCQLMWIIIQELASQRQYVFWWPEGGWIWFLKYTPGLLCGGS